jgi:hypothetical protein
MVEHGLLVKLVGRSVDYDGRIDEIADVGGTSGFVQDHVPVDPTSHPVEEVLRKKLEMCWCAVRVVPPLCRWSRTLRASTNPEMSPGSLLQNRYTLQWTT